MPPDLDALMDRALALARRGQGHVSPNPQVGCVVVDDGGAVVGEGWHARSGGSHAEANALDAARDAGCDLTRATVVVTLEPCAHTGKTPPCAGLLVREGVRRVVVGMRDPFPRVDGRGIERLRAAGIEVTVGVRAAACARLVEAFTTHVRTGRPLVTLKVAQTLDGFAATNGGDSRWVTGETARRRVHELRAASDAVLVGSGTARADDPALTLRHGVTGPAPLRVVLDRAGTLPQTLRLFTDGAAPTVAVVAEGVVPAYADDFMQHGGAVLALPERGGHLDLGALLDRLGIGTAHPGPDAPGRRPVQSLLVEAGPRLAAALLAADLVDVLHVFVAPKLLGAGRIALPGLAAARMDDARTWAEAEWEPLGRDVLLTARRAAPASNSSS